MRTHRHSLRLIMAPAMLTVLAVPLPTAADPAVEGQWDGPYCLPIVSIHTMHLHTGKILMWDGFTNSPHLLDVPDINCARAHAATSPGFCDDPENRKTQDDYVEGCLTEVFNFNTHINEPDDDQNGHRTNLFCAGHAQMEDGSILATGGHISVFGNHLGRRDVNIFRPEADTPEEMWELPPQDMAYRRWYPTNTLLPDGRVLITTGSNRYCFDGNDDGAECIRHVDCGDHGICTGQPRECQGGGNDGQACGNDDDCITQDEPGTCTRIQMARFPEIYDPADQSLATLGNAGLSIPFYPFNFVLPDGRVFYAGAEVRIGENQDMTTIDISGRFTYTLDVDSGQPWQFEAVSTTRGGSAVMYAPGKILKSGGAATNAPQDLASQVTEIINMNVQNPAWTTVAPMNQARTRHNLVVLPNGKILATGGTSVATGANNDADAVLPAELYDVDADSWTPMATMAQPRMYHSGTLLLPDGRVLSVGGGHGGGAETNYRSVEFYSPSYMFTNAPKPSITSAPESLRYGDVFEVHVGGINTADVDSVTLHRLASVTHSFDQDNRFVRLPIVNRPSGSVLEVLAPLHARIAPPGYYMLFVVSNSGVPSVAKYVLIDPPISRNQTDKPTVIWVDFDHPGPELGIFHLPFDTVQEGIDNVAPFGVIRIKTGSSGEMPTITGPMKIESYAGSAVVGEP